MCETRFDKQDLLNFLYSDYPKLFKNMKKFEFESICVQEGKIRVTDIESWVNKYVLMSVSILSETLKEPIFSCNSNAGTLFELFVDALEKLATHSKLKTKL